MEIILPELTPTEQFAEDDLNAWTPTEMEVPSVEEISDESENEVEILAIKPPPRLLKVSEEVLKMKEEERYGFLYRVQDRQAAVDAKVKKIQQEIANLHLKTGKFVGKAFKMLRRKSNEGIPKSRMFTSKRKTLSVLHKTLNILRSQNA